jgi:hypothetical protein
MGNLLTLGGLQSMCVSGGWIEAPNGTHM